MADNPECSGYSGGSLAGAIIGTFAATLLLLGLIYLVWEWQKKRRIKRSGLHNLVIVEDGGGTAGAGDGKGFAYDNPGFIDESSDAKKSQQGGGLDPKFNAAGKPVSQQNGSKKMPWGPLSFLFKSRNALDDSVVECNCLPDRKKYERVIAFPTDMEPQKYAVALKGHDFTGLGFNICGNMRDGIFVKDIMQRGPAAESKEILPGDQITGMTVSFKQMVLEDAITLLSYASPYEVNLEMLRLPEKSLPHKGIFMSSPAHPSASSGQSNTLERVCHPFFKSQSIDDLRKVGKEHLDLQVDRKKKQANGIHASKTAGTSATGGTIDVPTVVVVGNNENRSSSSSKSFASAVKLPKLPKMNFSLGSSSSSPKPTKAPEAHQKSSSSAQIQIPMPDEVDGTKTPVVVSVTKPEIIPRTKTKSSNVQKSSPIGEDMELVEAISPAIDKMTAEFEKNKKGVKESMQKLDGGVVLSSTHPTAVLDVQPVEIDMSGQPSVKVEGSGGVSAKMPHVKVDLPSADVDVRAPSMIVMSSGKTKADNKENKKKEKAAGKLKGGSKDIDITLRSTSPKGSSSIEMKEGESTDQQGTKTPQRPQKSKDKADKSKEKESKKLGKESKDKESSEHQQQDASGGEKSKFFKFGIPVLPDIGLNFGFGGNKSSSTAAEDKEKEKAVKEQPATSTIEVTEKASAINVESPKDKDKKKEKSPEPAHEKSSKDDKKDKVPKEKSSKSKDKNKEKEEKEASSKAEPAANPVVEEQTDASKEVTSPPAKEKSSSSGFSFNLKLPSFDKPLLKRKDSSSSTSGDAGTEQAIDSSPNAASNRTKESSDKKSKNDEDKPALDASPTKSKKKAIKEKKEKGSRPTSPEVSEGHRTTDDEADKSMDVVDSIPGEKAAKRGSGFHMPHIGIKLPKFGHSKQTYSFENAGDNKDLKHSHGPTAEALLESSPSMKLEVSANTPEFRKMTPTQDDSLQEVSIKMDQQPLKEAITALKNAKDEIDSSEVKVEIKDPKITLPSVELPSSSVKLEMTEKSSSPAPTASEEKVDAVKVTDEEATKKDQENGKEKESPKDKESKPSFVSKGLKGLRDLKDKVAHKLSHDHQQHSDNSSSEDEGEPGDEKVTKENAKKEKKTKESREKSKEEKQREKEEKAKEKERLKAEKKLKKAELKKKSAAAAHSSSSSSSSSSSDESDADDGKDKKKEKKKLKIKDKSSKEKKAKKEKKSEKSDKKMVGIEVKGEMPHVEVQTPDVTLSTSIEQKQISGHEAKLIPAKPPVVPRKSKESFKEESSKGAVGGEKSAEMASSNQKSKLKKTKSKGGASSSGSSSSSESDSENNKDDKPKKPKRTPKRKAPEIPSTSVDVPDVVKITTSVEVMSPPREESGKKSSGEHSGDMRESSKTPESGRRSASFGDLSSLQQPKSKGDGPLERAMSMDMAGDTEQNTETGLMPVGSSLEDLSVLPDSKTITHLSRGQQQQGLRDSTASKTSSSSNETLKSSPTSVVQVHPKEQQQQELIKVATTDLSQVAPVTTISVSTASSSAQQNPQQSSTVQKMMNETWSVMNNIVHEMDSPSLVKSAMSTGGPANASSPQVTISTSGTSAVDKAEAERVAQETVDEIMVKANQSLNAEMSVSVNSQADEPKVSVTTGDCTEPVTNMMSDLAHSLTADMEGGADSFSIASVKIQGADGDSEEPISVRNITVTNIKNVPKPAAVDDDDADQGVDGADTSSVDPSDPTKKIMRQHSKARLLQTVADANEIKVVPPTTPLRKDSSLSSSSCSVDSSPDAVKTEGTIKPIFSIETETQAVNDADSDQKGKSNGKTIEISSEELDGIMMSHADFLQKQAVAVGSTLSDSLDDADQLPQQVKDTFDSWVYVEQKNAAQEHTCPHSHSDPEPSTSSSNDDDEGPYSRNGALSPTTYRMETEYKFETSEMRVTSSPIPPEEAHVKNQATVYSTTMTLPQKTVTQITLGDPVMDAGGRIVSKITLDTSSQSAEDVNNKSSTGNNAELPKLESLK